MWHPLPYHATGICPPGGCGGWGDYPRTCLHNTPLGVIIGGWGGQYRPPPRQLTYLPPHPTIFKCAFASLRRLLRKKASATPPRHGYLFWHSLNHFINRIANIKGFGFHPYQPSYQLVKGKLASLTGRCLPLTLAERDISHKGVKTLPARKRGVLKCYTETEIKEVFIQCQN